MSDFQKNFLANKPLMSSVIGAGSMIVLQKYLNAPSGTIKLPFTEMRVPLFAVGGALGFASSLTTDIISDMVLKQIPKNQKFQHVESIVLHILLSGAGFAFVPKILYSLDGESVFDMSKMKLFAMAGVVSESVSQLIHEYFDKKQGTSFDAESYFKDIPVMKM